MIIGEEFFEEAVEAYSNAIKLWETMPKNGCHLHSRLGIKLYFQKGIALSFAQRFEEALAWFQKAQVLAPEIKDKAQRIKCVSRCLLTQAFCVIATYQFKYFLQNQCLPEVGFHFEEASAILMMIDKVEEFTNEIPSTERF